MAEHILQLYPELRERDELGPVLEHELLQVCAGARVPFRLVNSSKYSVSFGVGDRSSGVALAAERRLFLVDVWDRGVQMGSAQTPHLNEAAKLMHAFLVGTLTSAEICQRFPFFVIGEQAQVHEQGVAAEIAWQWENVKEHIAECIPDLLPMANTIANRFPFNELFPYISLEALCFSKTTGLPHAGDYPVVVALGPDDYEVRDMRGKSLGRGDEVKALNLLSEHMAAN